MLGYFPGGRLLLCSGFVRVRPRSERRRIGYEGKILWLKTGGLVEIVFYIVGLRAKRGRTPELRRERLQWSTVCFREFVQLCRLFCGLDGVTNVYF